MNKFLPGKLLILLFLILICLSFISNALAQNVAVTDDDSYSAASSAMLDVKSTTKGMLIPRLTTSERLSITTPVNGLMVYDINYNSFFYHNGTNWIIIPKVTTTASGGTALFAVVNAAGDTIFAVYNDGVKVSIQEDSKGKVGGFAVSGRTPTKAGTVYDYFRVTTDSTRIYINDTAIYKGTVGGFAVSGRTPTKGFQNNYFLSTPDSTRVYVNDTSLSKGKVGGFAVSGRTPTKGTSVSFLDLTPDNYFIGHESGLKTTGLHNTFIGYQAGKENTTGQYNSFMGYQAGNKNMGGHKNVIIGFKAGYENTSGICNVFIGPDAGGKNTTAWYNTFVGIGAGYKTTSNGYNSYYGINSGFAMTTGNNNAFYGSNSGYWFDGGSGNTFIGAEAGRGGPDDDPADPAGNNNTALGSFSGGVLESASNNLLLGSHSGAMLRTGTSNVFVGYGSGFYETGSGKLFIDNQLRGSASASYTSSLIYGEFNSTVASQFVRINGKLGLNKQPAYDIDANGSINSASLYIGGVRKDQNWDNAYTYRLTSASGTSPLSLTLSNNVLSGSVSNASTTAKGVVQLSNSYSGTSQTLAITEKALTDGLGTKVTGTGGLIFRSTTGVVLSFYNGYFDVYYDASAHTITLRNTHSSQWYHYWFQHQKHTSTLFGASAFTQAHGNQTIITFDANSQGCELHLGEEGGGGYVSIWLTYSNNRIVGHYIKY
jgi:hypothetical protein